MPRQEVFVTSKLAPKDQVKTPLPCSRPLTQPGISDLGIHSFVQGEGVAYEAVLRSLNELGMDYVDAYLVHWPGASGVKTEDPRNKELRMGSYRDLQKAAQEGRWRDHSLKEGARTVVGRQGLKWLIRSLCVNRQD